MPSIAPLRFSELGRSGTRMLMAMPITISGKANAGEPFEEKTRTVVINRTGCKLTSEAALAMGSQLTLSIGNSKRSAAATVVWVGDKKGKSTEFGVDFVQADSNFWGVMFPDDPGTTTSKLAPPGKSAEPPVKPSAPPEKSAPQKLPPVSSPVSANVVSAQTPAQIPPAQPPVQSGMVPAKPAPSPTAPGVLAPVEVNRVIPISVRRPQIAISDEGLKGLGGEMLLGTVQHLVREAFQEVLSQVVEDFDRYCVTSIERAKNAALAEMQERVQTVIAEAMKPAVNAGIAGARAQLEESARGIAATHGQRLEASMKQAIESTERTLAARSAAYDQRLAESAGEFCQELARRMRLRAG